MAKTDKMQEWAVKASIQLNGWLSEFITPQNYREEVPEESVKEIDRDAAIITNHNPSIDIEKVAEAIYKSPIIRIQEKRVCFSGYEWVDVDKEFISRIFIAALNESTTK